MTCCRNHRIRLEADEVLAVGGGGGLDVIRGIWGWM